VNFSIIICAHNPNTETFLRLLNAINSFDETAIQFEVIIIDNNSSPKIASSKKVESFLKLHSTSRIINEYKQGLTFARICGIKVAKYEWLVFFDDDNQPSPNYLQVLNRNIKKNTAVGAWGPANIEVVYMDAKVPLWFNDYKYVFQQQFSNKTILGYEIRSQEYYPYGTGLCIKKTIAEEYSRRVESNIYTLADRKGKSMSSGGDLQLVLTATDLGFAVGKIGDLFMIHNISSEKTTIFQLSKLIYGLETSVHLAHGEVLKWDTKKIETFKFVNNTVFLKSFYSNLFIQKNGIKKTFMNLSSIAGQQIGISFLKKQKHPSLLINIFSSFINK
jgi:glycosyltransferase involved in cell wall biosynthesis